MNSDLISIIVPVYNTKEYLEECITSLLNQSYNNYEVILVDDGSIDGSSDICDKYSKMENKIKTFHLKNSGVSCARNYGIKKCNGNWITFVDSDDLIAFDYLESLMNYVDTDTDMIIGRTISFVGDNKENIVDDGYGGGENSIFKNRSDKEELYKSIFVDNKNIIKYPHISTCSAKLLRKKVLMEHKIFYDVNLKLYEDAFLNLQFINNARKIKYIDKKIYFYRYNNLSSSNKFSYDIIEQYNYFYKILGDYSKKNNLMLDNYINYFKIKNLNIIFTNYFRCNKYSAEFIKNVFAMYGESLNKVGINVLPKKRKVLKILYQLKLYYCIYILYKI